MEHEWKIGDRFTLEYLITKVVDDYVIAEIGDAENILSAEEMALAKLIQPAAPEPAAKLDVTKPMRCRGGCTPISYLATDQFGRIWIQNNEKQVLCLDYSDLENIPEPKITGRREVVLLDSCAVTFADALSVAATKYIVGRAWVEVEAGDGMEDGE